MSHPLPIGAGGRLGVALVASLALGACLDEAPLADGGCDAAHPCPAGYLCGDGTCVPLGGIVVRCDTGTPCTVGVCLAEAGFCVQCTEHAHCPAQTCLPDAWVCGCRDGADCATGRCNAAVGACVSCYSDLQCASGTCDLATGVCEKVRRDEDASTTDTGDATASPGDP